MPELRRGRLAGVVGAVAAVALAVGAPGALAADTHWAGSQFTTPFVDGEALVREPSFPIGGVFVKATAEKITSVKVTFRDQDAPEEEPEEPAPQDPTAPPEEEEGVDCTPDDLASRSDLQNEYSPQPGDEGTDRWEFTVPTEHSVWPCNGRYDVVATADTASGDTHTMTAVLDVVVRPAPVEVVDVVVGEEERTVKITWEPLPAEKLAVDALGYRVERAGPGTTEGAFPAFLPLGKDRPLDGEPVATDSPREAGVYRYRVRSLREGPGGPVPASAEVSAFADGTVIGDPASTTRAGRRLGPIDHPHRRRGGVRGSGGRRPGPPGLGRPHRLPQPARQAVLALAPPARASRSTPAPSLSSGSLPFPHLGDCTHEGHPATQGQAATTSAVTAQWRSAASKPSSAMPAPPGYPS
jgi:hypothetical protein